MKQANYIFLLYLISGLIWFISGISITLFYQSEINSLKNMYSLIENKNEKCDSTDLFMTAECLRKQLKSFFHYNISNVGVDLTIERLKKEGGVCSHYARWYYDNIPNNFYKNEVTFKYDKNNGHRIVIISNNQGYCILDMINKECWRFNETE